jgi:hypothetical protein
VAARKKNEEEPQFIERLLTTDEANFARDGIFNARNTHIWSIENPHAIRERHFQKRFSVNVWGGIIGNKLIKPYILAPRLNAVSYLDFLNNHLAILLEDVPLLTRQNMWYLHDGAPAHFAREVRTWLDQNFPEKWIGRNGPVLCPSRSPDLNPCEFFLWGHMKQLVYATPVNIIE